MTAKPVIILRNARTHWKQLGLTVQGLINAKPCFLGCLICNSWSFIFLSLLKNSFCSWVEGKKVGCNRSLGRGCWTDSGGPTEIWGSRQCAAEGGSPSMSDLGLTGGSHSMCGIPLLPEIMSALSPVLPFQRWEDSLFSPCSLS